MQRSKKTTKAANDFQKKITLQLTKDELTHIRDLMSMLDFKNEKTISEHLSFKNGKVNAEETLWNNVFKLCINTGVPVADAAPNYQVMFADAPTICVIGEEND